jgi:hypothetical protein
MLVHLLFARNNIYPSLAAVVVALVPVMAGAPSGSKIGYCRDLYNNLRSIYRHDPRLSFSHK